MQLEYFKIFTDLVDTKSFSDAAKLNGITKAAVSKQVRVIEQHFKVQLIDRSQKSFQLTGEGMRFYDGAKEFVRQYEKMQGDFQELKKVISGTIRISTIPSIGLHVLPPYLKKFQHDYPYVSVQLKYQRTKLVYEEILNNSVDFGLIDFPLDRPQIEVIPFLDDELVLITHPSHPLANCGDVQLSKLADQRFIGLDPGGPAHDVIDRIFKENKIKPDPTMTFDHFETVIRAVEVNAGIGIVPHLTVWEAVKRGSLVERHFKGRKIIRPLAILHRKGRVLMPSMKKFIKALSSDLFKELKM